jgi:putative membrane protein
MNKINKNQLIWTIILIAFSYYFIYLIYTKKYLFFVHPKMGKFIILAIILFILIIFRQAASLKNSDEKTKFKFGYVLFLLPLMVAFLVNPENISANISKSRSFTMHQTNHNHDSITAFNVNGIIKNGTINLNEKNMSLVIENLQENPKKYENKLITMNGFVYKNQKLKSTEFIIARLLMTCCTADSEIVGLIADTRNAKKLKANTWLKVSGIIKLRKTFNNKTYHYKDTPYIKVKNLQQIKVPANQYVY